MNKILFKEKEKELMRFVQDFKVNITENDMFNLLKIKRRWPARTHTYEQATVEVISMYGQKHSFLNDETGYLNFDLMKDYYDKGFTILLADCFDLTEELRELEKELIAKTGIANIRGNMYFGNGKPDIHPSFDSHSHGYNVIQKQIYGTNYWIVDEQEYQIHEQEIILIPANVMHEVYKSDGKRLALTINLGYGD